MARIALLQARVGSDEPGLRGFFSPEWITFLTVYFLQMNGTAPRGSESK